MDSLASVFAGVIGSCLTGIAYEMSTLKHNVARGPCCSCCRTDRYDQYEYLPPSMDHERLLASEDDGDEAGREFANSNSKAAKLLGVPTKAQRVLGFSQPKRAAQMQAQRSKGLSSEDEADL